MKEKTTPPPITEEMLKESKKDFLEKELGIVNWTTPKGYVPEDTKYEFFIIDKETKFKKSHGYSKEEFKSQSKLHKNNNHWFIERVNGEIVNQEDKFKNKYNKIIEKMSRTDNSDHEVINEFCYQLAGGMRSFDKRQIEKTQK
jgi:hypothetical protein